MLNVRFLKSKFEYLSLFHLLRCKQDGLDFAEPDQVRKILKDTFAFEI